MGRPYHEAGLRIEDPDVCNDFLRRYEKVQRITERKNKIEALEEELLKLDSLEQTLEIKHQRAKINRKLRKLRKRGKWSWTEVFKVDADDSSSLPTYERLSIDRLATMNLRPKARTPISEDIPEKEKEISRVAPLEKKKERPIVEPSLKETAKRPKRRKQSTTAHPSSNSIRIDRQQSYSQPGMLLRRIQSHGCDSLHNSIVSSIQDQEVTPPPHIPAYFEYQQQQMQRRPRRRYAWKKIFHGHWRKRRNRSITSETEILST